MNQNFDMRGRPACFDLLKRIPVEKQLFQPINTGSRYGFYDGPPENFVPIAEMMERQNNLVPQAKFDFHEIIKVINCPDGFNSMRALIVSREFVPLGHRWMYCLKTPCGAMAWVWEESIKRAGEKIGESETTKTGF